MRARLGLLATVVNATLTLAPQLVGLVTLAPRDFGKFSIVYLLFAWGASLQLSVVCEPVARSGAGSTGPGRDYRAAATWLALSIGTLAGVVGYVAWGQVVLSVLSFVAVTAACFRMATRYGCLLGGDWRGVLTTDVTGMAIFVITCAAATLTELSEPIVVVAAWAAGSVGVSLVGPRPVLAPPLTLVHWVRSRRAEIAPLLKDSIVLDVSSIGAPYALAPLLGFASFGVYRALSNVAAPVRLLIEPLRPAWATLDSATLRRVLRRVSIMVALPLGVLAAVALAALDHLPWEFGVLTELSRWAVPAGAFVTLSMVSHLYYISARLHAPAADLWRGRLWQSGTAVVLPLGGALLGGLTAAIWGFVVSTGIGTVVWLIRAHRTFEDDSA